jgi:hypothetical protein
MVFKANAIERHLIFLQQFDDSSSHLVKAFCIFRVKTGPQLEFDSQYTLIACFFTVMEPGPQNLD